jgi:GlpG protein
MRMIGTIPSDTDAERFSDYLVTQQIGNMVEESAAGDWAVWIEHDDQIDRGKSELHAFLQNPADPKYGAAVRQADTLRKEQEKQQKRSRTKYVDVRTRWGQPRQWAAPLTLILIVLSCLVSVGTGSIRLGMQPREQAIDLLMFASPDPDNQRAWLGRHPDVDDRVEFQTGYWLDHLRRGQVWRLVTPILVHLSILHLLFNMFWLRDLGAMIEVQRGTRYLLPIVLACAIIPNVAQYYVAGPAFGGMSGVVYGLLGYVWVKGRYEPWLGLGIGQQTAVIMMAWLALGFTGMLGPIANAAHVGGLIVGAAIAYAPIALKRIRKKAEAR